MWSLAWTADSLAHGRSPLITDYIFYPARITILWANADAPVVLGWLVAPVVLAAGPILAYNVLQTAALWLSAWAAYAAVRRFVARPAAAFAGGLLYGFGPYMAGQSLSHLTLTFAVAPPLILILIHETLTKKRWSPVLLGLAAGVLLALQLLTASELVATAATVTVLGIVWAALLALAGRWPVAWKEAARRSAVAALSAAAVFVLLAAYPVRLLLSGPAHITHRPIRAFGYFVADLYNFVVPPGGLFLLHNNVTKQLSANFRGGPPESGAYLGVVLIAILLFAAVRWWRVPAVQFSFGALALTTIVTLGPHLTVDGVTNQQVTLPWQVFQNVPLLNEILVERMSLYEDLFAGLILAVFLDRALDSKLRFSRPLALIATAAALAFLVPEIPFPSTQAVVPDLFIPGTSANAQFHAAVPQGAVAVVLPADDESGLAGYAMLWQATDRMWFRQPEGDLLHGDTGGYAAVVANPSPLRDTIIALERGAPLPGSAGLMGELRAQLDSIGARAIVVGPMPHQADAVGFFTNLLGHPATVVGGAYLFQVAPTPD